MDGRRRTHVQVSGMFQYNDSEKSLIVENRILRELRKTNPEAKVAHLAYYGTMEVPEKVKPEEGIFLEFAPFFRTWDAPLNDSVAKRAHRRHKQDVLRLSGAQPQRCSTPPRPWCSSTGSTCRS